MIARQCAGDHGLLLVDPHGEAGEDVRQLDHVGLAVAAPHTERVQFHQLARVVLVDPSGEIQIVIKIAQHRRMRDRRAQKIGETPESRGAELVLIVRNHFHDIALLDVDIEVVEPEPRHPLFDRRVRIEVAQDRAGGGFAHERVFDLPAQGSCFRPRDGIGRLICGRGLGIDLAKQGRHRLPADAHLVDLGLRGRRQPARRAGELSGRARSIRRPADRGEVIARIGQRSGGQRRGGAGEHQQTNQAGGCASHPDPRSCWANPSRTRSR